MNAIDYNFINNILEDLSKRKIFWSEMDFQLSLAWEIKSKLNEADIYMERRFISENRPLYVDIWVEHNGGFYPIELKYKTKQCTIKLYGEQDVVLKEQGACDLGRYGFIRDISRLEELSLNSRFKEGYAIMLTNEPKYYVAVNKESIDKDFRIHEGKEIAGCLIWHSFAKWVDNYPSIFISGYYPMKWYSYNNIDKFKYTICTIKKR